ncbi:MULTISPECIES: hypothetical protein [unclassified Oscillibacter]|uniref:hypothetical protein n=1 Tax=unclassified Oscillibacter TaxID=2629304 RepID=UPI0025D7C7B5|nr:MULTISPECIES: hypothetical protein [unclassified Oscillibacter]
MDDKTRQTINQLNQDPATVQRLLTSQDGRRLVEMMSQANGGAAIQQAAMSAMRGDSTRITQMINQLMQSPEGAALVERINQATQK